MPDGAGHRLIAHLYVDRCGAVRIGMETHRAGMLHQGSRLGAPGDITVFLIRGNGRVELELETGAAAHLPVPAPRRAVAIAADASHFDHVRHEMRIVIAIGPRLEHAL